MEAVNKDAYNGVNLFEGTEPLPAKQSAQGSVDMGDPRDPGVDISSIMGTSTKIWQALKQELNEKSITSYYQAETPSGKSRKTDQKVFKKSKERKNRRGSKRKKAI